MWRHLIPLSCHFLVIHQSPLITLSSSAQILLSYGIVLLCKYFLLPVPSFSQLSSPYKPQSMCEYILLQGFLHPRNREKLVVIGITQMTRFKSIVSGHSLNLERTQKSCYISLVSQFFASWDDGSDDGSFLFNLHLIFYTFLFQQVSLFIFYWEDGTKQKDANQKRLQTILF